MCHLGIPYLAAEVCTKIKLSGVILGLYRGYIGLMEKKMETAGIPKGLYRNYRL